MHALWLAAGLIPCAWALTEEKSSPENKPAAREFPCPRAAKPLVIDGKLDEAEWQKATPQPFILGWAEKKEPAHGATVRMLWDDEYFYFGGELVDLDIAADPAHKQGETWQDDVFELFIKPSDEQPVYFEFHVSAANKVTDIRYPRPGAKPDSESVGWDSHMEKAVHLDGTLNKRDDTDKGWSVEIRIPWKDFADASARPKPGDKWRFSTGRYDYTKGKKEVNSATALFKKCSFHRVEDYDFIRFDE